MLPDLKMNQLTVETEGAFATLLELAANNDIDGFKKLIELDPCSVDEVGLWYGRQKGSKQMVLEHRTPLMVASMYGSIDVLKLILSLSKADVNRSSGVDKSTALHYAASGGSLTAVDAVKLLMAKGADPNLIDVNGLRPVDMIVASPKFPKSELEEVLRTHEESESELESDLGFENGFLDLGLTLKDSGFNESKRDYPVDPSLPDIKNSIYSTDEFRIFSFKVRPCSRAYSHDWTECPFVHPGENARRRDPRKYHYNCIPCPDFRKGTCRRADMCEYAHGVFECWLHPAQYRTRLCKDGTGCNRRVCFFAHTQDELRPLYTSTGSVVPSPRSMPAGGGALDFAAAMSLIPGSPSANGMSNWQQPNVPPLHLPGSNLQSIRLRSSLNARDMPSDQDLNLQLLNELSRQQRMLTPTKFDDIFGAESSSPRFSDQSFFSPRTINPSVFNPTFSPKKGPFAVQSTSSPRGSIEPISPMSSRVSILARENQHQPQLRNLSSRELGSSSVDPWSKWGPGLGPDSTDWAVSADELGKLRGSSSFDNGGEEPDLSWVQSLVKETPSVHEINKGVSNSNTQIEQMDQTALSAWIEQMQLDHLVAQQN